MTSGAVQGSKVVSFQEKRSALREKTLIAFLASKIKRLMTQFIDHVRHTRVSILSSLQENKLFLLLHKMVVYQLKICV